MKTRLSRRRAFHCLSHYPTRAWDEELGTAGACLLPEGHGHEYAVELTIEGAIESDSGMILDIAEVDGTLARVLDQLEGRRLASDVAAFATRPPTTENIAAYLLDLVTKDLNDPRARVVKLRLFESDDLWVDAWP